VGFVSSGGAELSNRRNITRANWTDLLESQCEERLGLSGGRYEFNLNHIRGIDLDNRTNVSPLQIMAWKVDFQNNGIENFDAHS
jgi:hypothetical protein